MGKPRFIWPLTWTLAAGLLLLGLGFLANGVGQPNPEPTLKWTADLPPGPVDPYPALDTTGNVYVVGDCLLSLDPSDGSVRWTSETFKLEYDECPQDPSSMFSSRYGDPLAAPVVSPGGRVFAKGGRNLYGFNTDGTLAWAKSWVEIFDLEEEIENDPYFQSRPFQIPLETQARINTQLSHREHLFVDGRERWALGTTTGEVVNRGQIGRPGRLGKSMILPNGHGFSLNGRVSTFSYPGGDYQISFFTVEGDVQQTRPLEVPQPPDRDLSIPWNASTPLWEGTFYVRGTQNCTSVEIEQFGHQFCPPLPGNNTDRGVLGVTQIPALLAFDLETGQMRWRNDLGGGEFMQGEPVLASDGTIYLPTVVGGEAVNPRKAGTPLVCGALRVPKPDDPHWSTLYAISPNGGIEWRFHPPTGQVVTSSAAVGADGTIYVPAAVGTFDGCGDKRAFFSSGDRGYVYALTPEGKVKWRHETDGAVVSAPTLAPDGTLYFSTSHRDCYDKAKSGQHVCDHRIYALQTDSHGLADSPWPMFRGDPQHTGQVQIVGDDQ